MIGRKNEIKLLNDLYESNRTHFIAVYGEMGVGKTYLINETFEGRITFKHTSLSSTELKEKRFNASLKGQLRHFYNSLILAGMEKTE